MDNIKVELHKINSDENLSDFAIDFMNHKLVKFCTLLVKQYQSQKKIEENCQKDDESTK